MTSSVELVALLSGFLPGYEPRYAYIVLSRLLDPFSALAISLGEVIVLSIVLGIVAEEAWGLLVHMSRRVRWLSRLVNRVEDAREKAGELVKRYGVIGLSLFVAVPLPVTGIYTGSVVAALLGLSRRSSILALSVGGASSVLIVALVTELGGRLVG